MSGSPWRLVTVDIDGTLTLIHGWRRIAERFGREPEYLESNARFQRKEIGEDPHLTDLLALARGRTIAEVESVLEATPRLEGIHEGVSELHRAGSNVALLSHNPPYVARWYAQKFGFDDLEGTPVPEPAPGGPIPLPGPVHADKAGGLQRLTARFGVSPWETVHIGDGWSDAELFPLIGGSVAVNSSYPGVDAAADLVFHVRDFRPIAEGILELRPRVKPALHAREG
ncbi:MAG: HAD family hydrolase [Thermoplasmata archaeon]